MSIAKCEVKDCDRGKRRNGPISKYCNMHYARSRRIGKPGEAMPIKVYSYYGQTCRIDNCNSVAEKKELCVYHYDASRNTTISAEQVAEMKALGCEVCGSKERPTLDHDHSCCPTGKSCNNCIRGILCHKCNTAAGLLDDDVDRMISLAAYILSSKDVLLNV
jgi:hypothetical protein